VQLTMKLGFEYTRSQADR